MRSRVLHLILTARSAPLELLLGRNFNGAVVNRLLSRGYLVSPTFSIKLSQPSRGAKKSGSESDSNCECPVCGECYGAIYLDPVACLVRIGTPEKDSVTDEEAALPDVDLSQVCAGLNYHKSGEDPVLKGDSEYPDWLWDVLEPVKSHVELPESSKMYWRRLNKQKARDNNLIRKQSRL